MSEWLIWWTPDGYRRRAVDVDESATLSGLDAAAASAAAEATSGAASATPGGPRGTLLLPAEHVLALDVMLPARNRRQLVAALPFAVEERIACELDRVHIANGPLVVGQPVSVRVIDREFLELRLAEVRASGVEVTRVEVDADRLPDDDDASVLLTAERALVRTAVTSAGVPRALLAAVLGRLWPRDAATQPPDSRRQITVFAESSAPLAASERAAIEFGCDATVSERNGDLLAVLAPPRPVIDLLQGPYGRNDAATFDPRPWRFAAGLAAAWFVIHVGSELVRGTWAGMRATATQTEAEALYREWFPGEQRIANLRRQVQGKLGAGEAAGSGAGALELLSVLASTVGGRQDVEVESVTFHGERGELAVQLLAADIASIDAMKAALSTRQVNAVVGSVEQDAGRVRARVRLGGEEA